MTIPKYKRDRFVFVSNLKEYTASDDTPLTYRRNAYLLSEHYTTRTSSQMAGTVRRRRNLLVSDNGNYTRMKAVARQFDDEGQQLLTQALDQASNGGVTAATLQARSQLADRIAAACTQALQTTDYQEVVDTQLSIRPHYMIGLEDLTIPVLTLCNLMHPVFEPKAADIKPYQQQTVQLYQQQNAEMLADRKEADNVANFMVLHAFDYASAVQAGQEASSVAQQGVAVSYGGPMHSKRWIHDLAMGDKLHQFEQKLPEAYLSATAITLGVQHGLGRAVPYHILGLGSPIMIALVGHMLRHSPGVSIDSTAPFRDAFAGVIYGSRKAMLKMNMYKTAAWCLINDRPFRDRSPFFTSFEQQHPADWKGLQQHLNVRPSDSVRDLSRELQKRPDLLEQYVPFFTPMSSRVDKDLAMDVRIARSGYNYWILRNICNNVKARRDDETAMREWMERQIDRYTAIAHPRWAAAVEWCYRLMND